MASKSYYPALTGLRAIAAYLVFFHHFNPFAEQLAHASTGNYAIKVLGAIIEQWHIGVSVFFVLSGFLIGTRYLGRIEPTKAWAKQYMVNRFARIYPLYFLLTAVTFGAMLLGSTHAVYEWQASATLIDKVAALVTNFTLTRAFFHNFLYIGVPTAWSLTVEECFYISAPFILLMVQKRDRALPLFAIALLSIGLLATFIATHVQAYGEFMQPVSFMLSYTYFGRCFEFLMGIGLALWVKKRGDAPAMRGTTLLGAAICGATLAAIVAYGWGYQPSIYWRTPLSNILLNNFLLPVGVVFLFHGLIHEESRFRRLLETKVLDLLGKSSYAFYLFHLGFFSDRLQELMGRNILLLFVVMNVASVLLYKLIEHPLHSAIIRRYKKAQAPRRAEHLAPF